MSIVSFGEYVDGISYKVLNEREVRASAGIMFIMGLVAVVAGVFFQNYAPIPYVSGFMMLSFLISVFINPKYAPSNIIARLIVIKQEPIYIGAVQKRFAWSLGLAISSVVFFLSIPLQSDPTIFESVCMLCLLCMLLMFVETAFGICVGCQLYFLAVKLKLMKQPEVRPNCMGNSCEVQTAE
ncbi:hypothetical protein BZG01_08050 [Labilibaculum manganireducens]|uniref:DUF4395 domain-containing protein n=1 Tax=Labilibaculum manganireducens TaxID=1940525 RepID=A0A2N3IAL7_9BACT|nr:DUF4395 domain-containing protein [Labilibaculum manganireducens]PKQ67330.1 hypothetical protein BZG01_08050 [Labilibaculum manganireducens]